MCWVLVRVGYLSGVIKVGSTLVTCTDTAEMTKVLEGGFLCTECGIAS